MLACVDYKQLSEHKPSLPRRLSTRLGMEQLTVCTPELGI